MIKMVNRIILLTIFILIIRGQGILLYLTSVSQGGGGGGMCATERSMVIFRVSNRQQGVLRFHYLQHQERVSF